MPFYFAWCGDDPIPPFSLSTLGDAWGGQWSTTGSTWGGTLSTGGDLLGSSGVSTAQPNKITGMTDVGGLWVGYTYLIANSTVVTGNLLYLGNGEGELSTPADPREKITFTLTSDLNTDQVVLDDTSFLEVGLEYGISGGSLAFGTTFTFEGSNTITISQPATQSANDVDFTITRSGDRNIIKNIADPGDLVVGETYSVFGLGIDNDTLGTYQDDGTLLLSKDVSETFRQNFIQIYRGTIYPDGGPFDPEVHARKDEYLLSIEIEHSEGHFPVLRIGVKNPRVGPLSTGRKVWCWLSWRPTISDPIVPLFHGRLDAIPSDIFNERVTFTFIAEPNDYEQQRNILTEALKVPPNYDPIWQQNGNGTPDTILEAYPLDWHTGRDDLEVSTSNILVGEDGTLDVSVSEHIRSEMDIEIADKPSFAIYMTATAKWTQRATGTVDITRNIVSKFQDAGSTQSYPNIESFTGDGLVNDWPKPGTVIGGGGWTVGLDTTAFMNPNLPTGSHHYDFVSALPIANLNPATFPGITISTPWSYWSALFSKYIVTIKFNADYTAARDWQEKVVFFVQANTQPLSTEGSVDVLSLSTDIIDQPVDPDGSTPLFDLRSNTFFKTERGQQAFQYLLYYCLAKLAFKSRAVTIRFTIPFAKAALAGISCRWNATLSDPRIPGGVATGKITDYKLLADASGGMRAVIAIGCTVGRGGSPVAAVEGEGVYAAPGYMAPGYQATTGGTTGLPGGELSYQAFDGLAINDDGVDFFNMTPDAVIKRLNVIAGPNQQLLAISTVQNEVNNPLPVEGLPANIHLQPRPQPDPMGALNNAYTRVQLEMNPINGSGFETQFVISVSLAEFPKTIDLEAPAL